MKGRKRKSEGSNGETTMNDVVDGLKQMPCRNARGERAKRVRAVAIDLDIAKTVRDIAENNDVNVSSVVTYAVQRLITDIEAAK
jgi:hypothetical protein